MGKKARKSPAENRYLRLIKITASIDGLEDFESKVPIIRNMLQEGTLRPPDTSSPAISLIGKTSSLIDSIDFIPIVQEILPCCRNLSMRKKQEHLLTLIPHLRKTKHQTEKVLRLVQILADWVDGIPVDVLECLYLMTVLENDISEDDYIFKEVKTILIANGVNDVEARSMCLHNVLQHHVAHMSNIAQEDADLTSLASIMDFTEDYKKSEWTEQLVEILKQFIEKGADPGWRAEGVLDVRENKSILIIFATALNAVMQKPESETIFRSLLELLELMMTEKACGQVDTSGRTFLHIITSTEWDYPKRLKTDFGTMYKRLLSIIVTKSPSMLNTQHIQLQIPLQKFLFAVMTTREWLETQNWWDSPDVLNFLVEIIPLLKSPTNIDLQDCHGGTLLHDLVKLWHFDKCPWPVFSDLISLVISPKNVNTQDNKGRTALHIVLEKLDGNPNLVLHEHMAKVINDLMTAENVNMVDKELMTPYGWIISMKEKDVVCSSNNVCLSLENEMLKSGADKSKAIPGIKLKRGYQIAELLDDLDSLQNKDIGKIRKLIETGYPECLECSEFQRQVNFKCMTFQSKKDQELITLYKNTIMSLTFRENAQRIWSTLQISAASVLPSRIVPHLFEVLSNCVKMGAQPSKSEVEQLARITDRFSSSKTHLKMLNLFFQAYRTSNNSDVIPVRLDSLSDIYTITEDYRKIASSVIRHAYLTLESCMSSGSVVNIVLFMADGIGNDSETIASCFQKLLSLTNNNWLKRSLLHITVMYCYNMMVLDCLPEELLGNLIHSTDLHGSTPLHVAYLCGNDISVKFLLAKGADKDVRDHFGVTPRELGLRVGVTDSGGQLKTVPSQFQNDKGSTQTETENVDVVYQKHCREVMETESNVFDLMKPMMVLPEEDRLLQSNDVKRLFERLVQTMPDLLKGEIVVAGSSREKLKAGRLDEVDVQIRLHIFSSSLKKIEKNFYFQDNVRLEEEVLGEWLHVCLVENLPHIKWHDIPLRLISTEHPWQFIYERPGPTLFVQGSIDVVPIIRVEDDVVVRYPLFPKMERIQQRQKLILKDVRGNQPMWFLRWGNRDRLHDLVPTYCVYEWDILDSLPVALRLSILIVKALLEIAYWSKGGAISKATKPISSYMLKTVLFWLLCDEQALRNSYAVAKNRYYPGQETDERRGSLTESEDEEMSENGRTKKLSRNNDCYPKAESSIKVSSNTLLDLKEESPQWMDMEDLKHHIEEGRQHAVKILGTILNLAKEEVGVESYKGQILPFFEERYDTFLLTDSNKDLVAGLCEVLLGRLDASVFYGCQA